MLKILNIDRYSTTMKIGFICSIFVIFLVITVVLSAIQYRNLLNVSVPIITLDVPSISAINTLRSQQFQLNLLRKDILHLGLKNDKNNIETVEGFNNAAKEYIILSNQLIATQLSVVEQVKENSILQSDPNQKPWKIEQQKKRQRKHLDKLDKLSEDYGQYHSLNQIALRLISSSELTELKEVMSQLEKLESTTHEFLNEMSTTLTNIVAKKQKKVAHLEYGAKQIMVYALFWFVFLGTIASFLIAKTIPSSSN